MSSIYTTDHRDYFLQELERRCERRSNYSKRAFARDLDLSPASVVGFLNGSMRFSAMRTKGLGRKLNLTPDQITHWTDLMTVQFSRNAEKVESAQFRIRCRLDAEKNSMTLDQFRYVSEWQHAALLELIQVNPFKYSVTKSAATALALPVALIDSSLKRLEQLGLITKEKNSFRVVKNIQLSGQVPSSAIREFHSQVLQKAMKAIDEQDIHTRYNSTTIFRISKDRLPEVQEALKQASWKIMNQFLEKGPDKADGVYCLAMQFFNLLK